MAGASTTAEARTTWEANPGSQTELLCSPFFEVAISIAGT
jgi:hypothetical protein